MSTRPIQLTLKQHQRWETNKTKSSCIKKNSVRRKNFLKNSQFTGMVDGGEEEMNAQH
jgi:hypothetical protein